MNYNFVDNTEDKQYELHTDGWFARIEYTKTQNAIYLLHTEVPLHLEGKGIGSAIVKEALEDIKQRGIKLVVTCPFVAGYIKRHPEWRELLLKKEWPDKD